MNIFYHPCETLFSIHFLRTFRSPVWPRIYRKMLESRLPGIRRNHGSIVMPHYLLDSGKIIDIPFAAAICLALTVRLPGETIIPVHKKPRTYSTSVKAIIHRGISLPRAR
jgi:hypothetical protein